MMGLAILIALATAAQSPEARGVHPADVEQRLAFIVEDWTIEGMEATYRETCRWYHQRSFVVCETTDSSEGVPSHSVSILGWSAATRNYTYHHYGQSGRSRSETCFANDRQGLTCLAERRTDDGMLHPIAHLAGRGRGRVSRRALAQWRPLDRVRQPEIRPAAQLIRAGNGQ